MDQDISGHMSEMENPDQAALVLSSNFNVGRFGTGI